MKKKWFKCHKCVAGKHSECTFPKACGCKKCERRSKEEVSQK